MGDPLGALPVGETLQRRPETQQGQRPPGEGVAAAAAATATATAAAAAAAIRSAAAAIRTAAAALPLQPPLRDSPTAAAAAAGSGRGGSTSSLAQPPADPALPRSSAAGEGAPTPPSPAERAELFRQQLEAEPAIDMRALRGLAYGGIPDDARGLRSAVWRLLLGLLPPERGQWERVLRRKRAEYAQFCEELIVDPKNFSTPTNLEAAPGSHPNPLLAHGSAASSSSSMNAAGTAVDGGGSAPGSAPGSATAATAAAAAAAAAAELQRLALSQDDHPLSTSSSSKWQAYFQDVEVQEQIERDVARTHPDMHFFSGPSGAAAEHRRQMRRALFVFAKLNPGLRYVQGMNELYAPLYYLMRTDPEPEAAAAAEADAFWCFCDLMGEFRDHFCQQLDNSTVGIRATLTRLSQLLRSHDEELWQHLEKGVKINPQFYAFRWITLALTQEFSFPDALRLWDTLLSDPAGRTDCLLRICLAMLLHVRQELLQGDFAVCMKLLQRYPPVDVNLILGRADALKRTKIVICLD